MADEPELLKDEDPITDNPKLPPQMPAGEVYDLPGGETEFDPEKGTAYPKGE
jgi:hypothetical protein